MSIPTSNAYKTMMRGRRVSSRMEVKISSGNSVYNLTDDDIVRGSWSNNWRSSNNRAFSLGTCYASSLSFSSFVSVEPEIDGQYVTIEPTVYYKVDAITEVAFPLGVYRCDSPKVFSKTTSYECYDLMLAFDKRVESRFSGTPYNMLVFICGKCGVELATTAQQISRMVNFTQNIVIDPERVNTYRDALSYISIVLGAYCIMDRTGKLSVRQFHTTSDMELVRWRRISTTFGGYKTCFCGVKCRFLAEQNFYPYTDIEEETDGIILDLGDIPIIEDSDTIKKRVLSQIKSVVMGIEYYPCEIEMVGDPSIEAGDMITTKDRYGFDRDILLTSVTYQWRSSANILSEGSNPKLEAVSTQAKKAQASQDAYAKAARIVTSTYVNANEISLSGQEETDISYLRFVTNKELTAIFGAEIPVYSSGEGIIKITYSNSGIDGDVVRARLHEGYNLVTLVNHLYYAENEVVLLTLSAQTEAVGTGSAPTAVIGADTIRSYVFAQGIEAEAPWDGIIVVTEDINAVETAMIAQGITETCAVYVTTDEESAFASVISAVETEMQSQTISDTMIVTFEYGDQIWRCGMGNRAGMIRAFAPWTV